MNFDKHKYQKDFDQALNYYRQVVSKGPEDSLKDDAKFAEGNLLLDQKRFQEALIAFQDIDLICTEKLRLHLHFQFWFPISSFIGFHGMAAAAAALVGP